MAQRGGARPGAGAKKGSKHRATKELEALQEQVRQLEEQKRTGKKRGVDIVEEFALAAAGYAAYYQPREDNPNSNEEKFMAWAKLAVVWGATLGEWQTPKLRAQQVPEIPPPPPAPAQGATVINAMGKRRQQDAADVYIRLVRGGKAA